MSKAGQLTIALMCGLNHESTIVKKLLSEPAEIAPALRQGVPLSQDDLFEDIGIGENFFQQKEFWPNLPRVIAEIRASGNTVTPGDFFKKIVANGKTAANFAVENESLKHLFCPEIWEDKTREMEKAWFSIPKANREMKLFRDMRRAAAAVNGKEPREDALERMGVTLSMVRAASQGGNLHDIHKKLADAGDGLLIEDILLPDIDGDHALDTRSAWRNFKDTIDIFEKLGQKFEPWHFLHKHVGRSSPLDSAVEYGDADKIFNARVWRGRPQEMMELFRHVPVEKQGAIAIDTVLKEIEETAFGETLRIDDTLRKGQLTGILNAAAHNDSGAMPLRGLGLKKTWDNIEQIRKTLDTCGEPLTLEDLRLTSGHNATPAFVTAASCGKFSAVMDILGKNGESLDVADLISKDKNGASLINVLTGRDEISQLVKPELWANRPADFKRLWAEMPSKAKDKVDYQDFVSQMNLIAMRRKFSAVEKTPAP